MLRRIALLLFCFCGIFAAYMQYGFQQKALYELKDSAGEQWSATSVQLMLQCVANIVVALAVSAALRVGFGKNAGRIDVAPLLARGPSGAPTAGRALRYFVPIGLAYSLAMLSSNVALRYVSFSAQALAKSCKIIPVMLMRIVINKKRYTILQVRPRARVSIAQLARPTPLTRCECADSSSSTASPVRVRPHDDDWHRNLQLLQARCKGR